MKDLGELRGQQLRLHELALPRPVWIYEGVLLFITEICCTYRDSTYKREWEGIMTECPRLSRPRQGAVEPQLPLQGHVALEVDEGPGVVQLPGRAVSALARPGHPRSALRWREQSESEPTQYGSIGEGPGQDLGQIMVVESFVHHPA